MYELISVLFWFLPYFVHGLTRARSALETLPAFFCPPGPLGTPHANDSPEINGALPCRTLLTLAVECKGVPAFLACGNFYGNPEAPAFFEPIFIVVSFSSLVSRLNRTLLVRGGLSASRAETCSLCAGPRVNLFEEF